jgi:2-methylcitrate dehydratase PrpD
MMAQYSVPFCVALALHTDPVDPRVFGETTLNDPSIREVCRHTTVTEYPPAQAKTRFSTRIEVTMKDGRKLVAEAHDYEGMPGRPLSQAQLRDKFMKLTSQTRIYKPQAVFERLEALERLENVATLFD